MKKFVCFVLTLILIIPCFTVYANPDWGILNTAGDIQVGNNGLHISYYPYADGEVSFTISESEANILKDTFKSSNLVFDEDATKDFIANSNIDKIDLPYFAYSDTVDYISEHLIFFDETSYIDVHIKTNKESETHEIGIFTYKDNTLYDKVKKILDENAKEEYERIQAQPKFSDLKENEQFIYNVTPIYKASFMEGSQKWYWGFCSYTTTEENKNPITAAYISNTGLWAEEVSFGMAYLSYKSDSDNIVAIDYTNQVSHINNHEITKLSVDTEEETTWAYKWTKMHFNVSNDNTIEGLQFSYSRIGNSSPVVIDVDMSTYEGDRKLPEIAGFSFTPNANIPSEENTPESDIKKEELTEEKEVTLLDKVLSDKKKLVYLSYENKYRYDELNTHGIPAKLDELLKGCNFSKTDAEFEKQTPSITIQFDDENGSPINLSIGWGDIMIEDRNHNVEKYDIVGANYDLYNKIRELLTPLKDAEITDFIVYEKLSRYRPKWTYTFEITLNQEQLGTWIGEVAENGKVTITVTHDRQFINSYYITLTGNGKSYSLHNNGSLGDVFGTDVILVDNDTPLPHHFEKGGAIALSWSNSSNTLTAYNSTGELYVMIYAKKDNSMRASKSNIDLENPVGGKIAITKLRSEDLTDVETEVPTVPERKQVFADVPPTHWAHSQIEKFYYASIVRGIGAGLCAPDSSITYEHFGLLLERLFGYKYENTSAEPAIRQDVFAALVKACGLEPASESNNSLDKFADTHLLTEDNIAYVKTAVKENLVEGYGENLGANNKLTRAEAITLLYRAIKEVYGITDSDLPEYYKLSIKPENNEYAELSAGVLVNAEIANKEVTDPYKKWYVNSTDTEKIDGGAVIIFGEDAIKDTNIYAVCNFGGDIYTFDSTSMYHIRIRSQKYISGRAVFNVYRNGNLFRQDEYYSFEYDGEIGELMIKTNYDKLVYDNAELTKRKMPNVPEVQPYDIYMMELEEFADGKGYMASMTEVSNALIIEDMYRLPSGTLNIDFNKDGSKVRIFFDVTAPTANTEMSKFSFEIAETIAISDNEIVALFNISCDGISIGEKVSGKITGLNSDLGEEIIFTTDDGAWNIKLEMVEKSGL